MEQEYLTIITTIRKTAFGIERTDKLISKASRISEKFKDDIKDNFSIDLDELVLNLNRVLNR